MSKGQGDFMKNNKGLTLVELIVTIAILSLVGIGVGTIINQSLRQYRMSNTEVSLQQEAQLAGNQLTNLVLDASDGVSAESGKLNIYDYDLDTKGRGKIVIAFDATNGTLTYSRYEMADGDEDWTPVVGETEQLFADYVKEFTVEFLDEDGAQIAVTADAGGKDVHQVCLKIRYELQGQSYDYEQTITLRNQILASNIVEGSFDDEVDPEEPGTGDSEEPGTGDSEEPGTGDSENPGTGDTEEPGTEDSEEPGTGDIEEPDVKVPVVTGISVAVPDGNTNTRTTTATIILTGENLLIDDASEILAGLTVTKWGKQSGNRPWQGASWTENPNGITVTQKSVTASEMKYTITYTVTLSQGYQNNYTSSGCLKIEATYGDLKASDTFSFSRSR